MRGFRLKSVVFGAVALLCFTSCFVSEKQDPDVQEQSIWYNLAPVKEGAQVKAAGTSEFSGTFGSFAYRLPAGKNFDANRADATTFINNVEISKTSGVWKAATSYFWPNDGSSLSFISYAPYKSSLPSGWSCTAAAGFTITGYTMPSTTVGYYDADEDILVSDVAKDLTGNVNPGQYYTRGVPTLFKHILCKVKVVAHQNNTFVNTNGNDSDDYVTINSVRFDNIYIKGNYNYTGWSGHTTTASYSKDYSPDIKLPSDLTLTEVFAETLMMPQPTTKSGRANAPALVVSYTICTDGASTTKTATLPLYNSIADLAAWQPGKIIAYNLSISVKDEFIEFSGKPGDWSDGTGGGIDMGI